MLELVWIAAEAAGEAHPEPSALGMTATAWVSLAMLVLLAIVAWKKVPAAIGASLDAKIASIKAELDEAKALRDEAEKLRSEYEAKLAAAAKEAEAMKARAEAEANLIIEDARANATALVARRQQMASDKIAAAERAAVADIRATVAKAATGAASSLISDVHNADADKAIVDGTVAMLGRALN